MRRNKARKKKKEPLVIIILGLPGSGKGTQAKLLCKKFGLEYMGSGDLLRARKKKKDFTGVKIASYIDNGKRVPTSVIAKIWLEKLEGFKNKKGFEGLVIDGSPRTALEAELLGGALEWYDWLNNKKVLLVDISKKEAFKRLTKRRMCKKCGRILPFVGKFKELKECDKCGGQLVARADDDAKGVKQRLKWFDTDVKPVIDYYEKKGELIKINGEQSIEDVFVEILEVIR